MNHQGISDAISGVSYHIYTNLSREQSYSFIWVCVCVCVTIIIIIATQLGHLTVHLVQYIHVLSPQQWKHGELIVCIRTVQDMQIETTANGISTISRLVSARLAKH